MIYLLLLVGIATCTEFIHIDVNTKQFVDQYGRAYIFHGVNAVYKIPPFIPQTDYWNHLDSLTILDAIRLKEWGFNVVRLGMMWAGYNPTENVYNETYLIKMRDIVRMLADYDIYVIFDMHQDVLSRKYCGEGMPDYLTKFVKPLAPFPAPILTGMPIDENGYPKLEWCLQNDFGIYYSTYEVTEAFQELYTPGSRINTEFHKFWSGVSSVFKNEPNLLGYDLINEPSYGNVYEDPRREYFPGYTDKNYLQPLFESVHKAIRKFDDRHIIFYGTTFNFWFTGLKASPGGDDYLNRSAYSYHMYCPYVNRDGVPENRAICNVFDKYLRYLRVSDCKKLKNAGILSEFGALDDEPKSVEELNVVTGLMDEILNGFIYWNYKSYHDITTANMKGSESFYWNDGILQKDKVRALSRSYGRIIGGDNITMSFDPKTSKFSLKYKVVNNFTEVYLNEDYYYQGGYSVIAPGLTYEKQKNFLRFYHDPSVKKGDVVTITITKK